MGPDDGTYDPILEWKRDNPLLRGVDLEQIVLDEAETEGEHYLGHYGVGDRDFILNDPMEVDPQMKNLGYTRSQREQHRFFADQFLFGHGPG